MLYEVITKPPGFVEWQAGNSTVRIRIIIGCILLDFHRDEYFGSSKSEGKGSNDAGREQIIGGNVVALAVDLSYNFV